MADSLKRPQDVVDSHSSALTNYRLNEWFVTVDALSFRASNNPHLNNIQAYYNALEVLYRTTRRITSKREREEADKQKKIYDQITEYIQNDPRCRTTKATLELLKAAKAMHKHMIDGLHDMKYFVRTSKRSSKGLDNMDPTNIGGVF